MAFAELRRVLTHKRKKIEKCMAIDGDLIETLFSLSLFLRSSLNATFS